MQESRKIDFELIKILDNIDFAIVKSINKIHGYFLTFFRKMSLEING